MGAASVVGQSATRTDRLPIHCYFTRTDMEDLNKEQQLMLRKVFDSFDHHKKGSIPSSMVQTIFTVMGHRVDAELLKSIIAEVDADGSGELEFPEFVQLAAQFLIEEDAEEMQNELKEAFRLYDKEGNGYITPATLRDILHELDDKLTPDDLDGIIDEIDEDGSGTIDFDEFMTMMTGED